MDRTWTRQQRPTATAATRRGRHEPVREAGNEFADADLASELVELTRAANRANATIYTIDPRGLVGGPDLDEKVDMMDWQNYVREVAEQPARARRADGRVSRSSTRTTSKALKRIDKETSDYYVVGYYSTQSGSDEEAPQDRHQGDAAERQRAASHRVHAEGAAAEAGLKTRQGSDPTSLRSVRFTRVFQAFLLYFRRRGDSPRLPSI